MPRYHFNIRTGPDTVQDDEGSVHFDLDAARREAVLDARDSMSRAILTGHDISKRTSVEICDGAGLILQSVAYADAILIEP